MKHWLTRVLRRCCKMLPVIGSHDADRFQLFHFIPIFPVLCTVANCGDDAVGALRVLQLQLSPQATTFIIFSSSEIWNGNILVPAYQVVLEKGH